MFNWISQLWSPTNEVGNEDEDKYGLQMSLTLSSQPVLAEYWEGVRIENQSMLKVVEEAPWFRKWICEVPDGRQDYPTIIVRGNEASESVFILFGENSLDYTGDGTTELKNAIEDESYYGKRIFIKQSNFKKIDPILLQPIKFAAVKDDAKVVLNSHRFWNVPMIFVGFEDVNNSHVYDMFVDILRINPIGKAISSIEFLEYMSQPVIFWVKLKQNRDRRPASGYSFDILEHKINSGVVTKELFEILRDSYLKGIGRKLVSTKEGLENNYLQPQ
ncbi:similar to Vanderwaltozyma polyspora Kpol_449p10 hypothetical protein [Vanderwaltozyma polyspora DSM 70294] [Maudiozyma saulgeensis]|uniref:Uncharacterized protein n=1 Tax=Maudiozyma saulgeensis TaxID=1789683 RepID=A0A1X7R802_9SACH|nr:similar to Vanderwaltozyma polyspora Kpol_449p10 hypothetical protein [Vanderwaltozyma polyspora DSM 70294] [Kazachstania saulgeensis]